MSLILFAPFASAAFEIQIEVQLSNPQTSTDPTTLFGQWLAFPQPQKTLAAFFFGDCCLGHPKVKWFALERSPNVSHPTTVAHFTRIPAGHLCGRL
jgi:hypothetical protein